MGALAAKIGQAFKDRTHRELEVPEWGVTIHVFPLTLGNLARINEETDPMRRLVRIIMVRARNADGTPMFDLADAEALMDKGTGDFGPDVVMRVCAELGDAVAPDEAEAEKN